MVTRSAELVFAIPCAHSLKDKRMVARSLIDKTRHRFNASVAEVGTQDILQTLSIGIAVVSGDGSHAQRMLEEIVRTMEKTADAELISVRYE